jgi:hypothetical protein
MSMKNKHESKVEIFLEQREVAFLSLSKIISYSRIRHYFYSNLYGRTLRDARGAKKTERAHGLIS